jgi:hypothetical protein
MANTSIFVEYKQYIECLSSWLTLTNKNIHEMLQSVNKQEALLIVEVRLSTCYLFTFFF